MREIKFREDEVVAWGFVEEYRLAGGREGSVVEMIEKEADALVVGVLPAGDLPQELFGGFLREEMAVLGGGALGTEREERMEGDPGFRECVDAGVGAEDFLEQGAAGPGLRWRPSSNRKCGPGAAVRRAG